MITPRAPRLTERLIAEDLPELLSAVQEHLDYLESRLNDTGVGALHADLRPKLELRRDRLCRAAFYISGKIAAESQQRADAKS